MSGRSEQDKYIKCKGCKCKYINDEEHIKEDFGYNRLGEQLKSCVKCRTKNKHDKEKKKQQSLDTNVNYLCTRCYQVKPRTEFGEYEMHVYDKELKRTQQVMVPYKSCNICREQCNKYQEDNADKQKHCKAIYKNKKLQQEVDKEIEQVCSRCLKIKPKSDYGEYKTWAFTEDTSPVQEIFLPYKSCKECRDKDKLYNKERRGRSDISTSDTSDDNGCIEYESDCYYDGCVEYNSDGDMVGFK